MDGVNIAAERKRYSYIIQTNITLEKFVLIRYVTEVKL